MARLRPAVCRTEHAGTGSPATHPPPRPRWPSPPKLLNLEVRPQPGADGASQAAPTAKLSKSSNEAALRKLEADGWLKHAARAGHYTLGVRCNHFFGGGQGTGAKGPCEACCVKESTRLCVLAKRAPWAVI